MSNNQETLIYIEKETFAEADFMSRNFVNKEVKNRAYINTLGAELVIKYLKSEGLDVDNLHNIHSISKILESIDIADIILPNVHIDVRTVFDRSQIFIPKSHLELGVTPDVYVVLILDREFKYCELAGYFTPDKLNRNNANSTYYFMEPEKLSSPETLTKFIKNFSGETSKTLTENEFFKGRELSVTMSDHNITTAELKELLSLLVVNNELRESVIEYDNFETLAYNTVKETDITTALPVVEISSTLTDENTEVTDFETEFESGFEEFEDSTESNNENSTSEESSEEESSEENQEEELQSSEENTLETIDFENFEELESVETQLDADFLDDLTQAVEESNQEKEENRVEEEEENIHVIESVDIEQEVDETIFENTDPTAEIENINLNFDELPIESLDLDEGLNIDISNNDPEEDKKPDIGKVVADSAKAIGEVALGAGAAAEAVAGAAASAEIAAEAAVTKEAIKLAGISGEILDDLIEQNSKSQQKNLDRIDYTNISVNAEEIPEEIASIISVPSKPESSEEYATPTDLSELKAVDNPLNKEEIIEHETVDLNQMETISTEEFTEHTDGMVNLENIQFESPTKPVENLSEIIKDTKEEGGIDLPDVSNFSLDDINDTEDLALNQLMESEQHLTEFPTAELDQTENLSLNIDELSLNSENLTDLSFSDKQTEELTELPQVKDETLEEITEDTIQSFNADEELSIETLDEIQGENELPTDFEFENIVEQEEENQTEDNIEFPTDFNLEDEQDEEKPSEEIPDFASEFNFEDEQQEEKPTEETVELPENSEIEDSELTFEELDNLDSFVTEDLEQELTNTEEPSSETATETIDNLDEFTNIEQAGEVFGPELDDEFSTDLNTEFNADETLHDANPARDLENDAIIENPEEQTPLVTENSTVISDKTFAVGEIPIDINIMNNPQVEDTSALGSIYNNNQNTPSMLQTPGKTGRNNGTKPKGGLGILGALLTLVVVCAIGFGVAKMFKTPTEETPQPTTDDALPTDTVDETKSADSLNVDTNNVVNMDNDSNALVGTTQTPTPIKSAANNGAENIQQTASTSAAKKSIPPTAFLEVKKLSWEVPDYIAYNPQFKQYFQAAGRSLKLSLTTDLLLATEFAYSNEVKITITYNKDGSFKEAKVVKSSGSTQIDKIVLQTVNQTLKVLKAPQSVGNDENTVAILKIYL